MVRAGVVVPKGNAGFDASEVEGARVPNEKPPVLDAGLVSDCEAGETNKSPVGALAVEEAPNVNILLAGVEGAAAVVCLADWSKENVDDDSVSLDCSVGGASPDAGVGVNKGLCANDKPGFEESTLSDGADVATFVNGAVVVSVDWVVDFVLCSGADAEVPNPGNDTVAPPNRGLGRARSALSFFCGCGADEGMRLNGSELLVDGSFEDDVNVGWIDGARPKLNGTGRGSFSSKLALCTGAWAATPDVGEGDVEVVDNCGTALASDVLAGVGPSATSETGSGSDLDTVLETD